MHRLVPSLLCGQCSALLHTLRVPQLSLCRKPSFPRYSAFFTLTSFRSLLETYDCSALPLPTQGTMASADFLQFVVTAAFGFFSLLLPVCKTSPGKNNSFPPMQPPHLPHGIRAAWDFVLYGTLVRPYTAYYVISVRRFRSLPASAFFPLTSSFLQIPPLDGHPCLRLTLPAAERVVVFHHLVVAHAGRTK